MPYLVDDEHLGRKIDTQTPVEVSLPVRTPKIVRRLCRSYAKMRIQWRNADTFAPVKRWSSDAQVSWPEGPNKSLNLARCCATLRIGERRMRRGTRVHENGGSQIPWRGAEAVSSSWRSAQPQASARHPRS
jgi:hypothetical protein